MHTRQGPGMQVPGSYIGARGVIGGLAANLRLPRWRQAMQCNAIVVPDPTAHGYRHCTSGSCGAKLSTAEDTI